MDWFNNIFKLVIVAFVIAICGLAGCGECDHDYDDEAEQVLAEETETEAEEETLPAPVPISTVSCMFSEDLGELEGALFWVNSVDGEAHLRYVEIATANTYSSIYAVVSGELVEFWLGMVEPLNDEGMFIPLTGGEMPLPYRCNINDQEAFAYLDNDILHVVAKQ